MTRTPSKRGGAAKAAASVRSQQAVTPIVNASIELALLDELIGETHPSELQERSLLVVAKVSDGALQASFASRGKGQLSDEFNDALRERFTNWWERTSGARGDFLVIVHLLASGRLDFDHARDHFHDAVVAAREDTTGRDARPLTGGISWDALVTDRIDNLRLTSITPSDILSHAEGGVAEQERDSGSRKGTGRPKGGSAPTPSLQDEAFTQRPPGQPSLEEQLKRANDRAEKAERARDELASKLELAERRANAATRDAGIAAARATRLEQTVESERNDKAALAAALNGKVTAEAAVHLVGARILEDSKPNGGLGKVSTSLLADVGRYALPSLGLTQKDIEDLVEEAKKEAEATCSNGWSESDTFLNHANHAEVKRRQAAARQHLGLDVLQQPFAAYQAAIGGFREEKPKRGESWTAQEKKSLRTLLNAVARSLCAHLQYGDGAGLLHVAGGSSGTFQVQDPKTGTPVATVGQVLPLLCLKAAPPTER